MARQCCDVMLLQTEPLVTVLWFLIFITNDVFREQDPARGHPRTAGADAAAGARVLQGRGRQQVVFFGKWGLLERGGCGWSASEETKMLTWLWWICELVLLLCAACGSHGRVERFAAKSRKW